VPEKAVFRHCHYTAGEASAYSWSAAFIRDELMAKIWRERVTYAAMSLVVAWHTLAMVVAPAPGMSDLTRGARVVLEPYLHFFGLDNDWAFFAPEVVRDSVLRYVIKDDAGVEHSFDAGAGLNWFHPSYIWFRAWYIAVLNNPDDFGEEFAALFCREHAELHPVKIMFFEVDEQDYGPVDRLRGKQPLDLDFTKVFPVETFACPH
jgi:hypothetical protein